MGRAVRAADDRGAGSVLVLGVVAVALVLVAATALVGGAYAARARAAAAADLAALAGAQHLADGGAGPCDHAAVAAGRNGGSIVSCVRGARGDVTVRVRVDAPVGAALGVARAGPRAAGRGPGRAAARRRVVRARRSGRRVHPPCRHADADVGGPKPRERA
jgi:secretion/DNA translocation related TadE-like protein